MRSPPRRRNDFGRDRPSTVTVPASIARWISARAAPRAAAATASSRPGSAENSLRAILDVSLPAAGGLGAVVAEGGPSQEERPDHDRAIGSVEDRPSVQIDEVDDVPPEPRPAEDAVGKVAQCAAED